MWVKLAKRAVNRIDNAVAVVDPQLEPVERLDALWEALSSSYGESIKSKLDAYYYDLDWVIRDKTIFDDLGMCANWEADILPDNSVSYFVKIYDFLLPPLSEVTSRILLMHELLHIAQAMNYEQEFGAEQLVAMLSTDEFQAYLETSAAYLDKHLSNIISLEEIHADLEGLLIRPIAEGLESDHKSIQLMKLEDCLALKHRNIDDAIIDITNAFRTALAM